MFSKAYEIASQYTHPVIVSMKYFDNTVESGLGSFVILNDEGWIATAAHILDAGFAQQQHEKNIEAYKSQVEAIKTNDKLSPKIKQKMLKKFVPNNKWIENVSFWWGHDLFKINNIHILIENDLAIGKIENYDPKFQLIYPKLKKPDILRSGTSLCKLGYPFYSIQTSFDDKANSFTLAPGTLPIPRFPIDGIFTRNIFAGKSADGKFDIKFLETSTPGLRGQSGGPTFDINGAIWAIQSRTNHLELGFAPRIKRDKREIEENQFLNVGWGIHVESLISFLNHFKVKFELTEN